jgi:uncharacterized OsmC-like protein
LATGEAGVTSGLPLAGKCPAGQSAGGWPVLPNSIAFPWRSAQISTGWRYASGGNSRRREQRMDATELKAMQAPLKEAYRGDAAQALITLRARGSIDDQSIACKVETGRALAVAGLHPATGGSGLELCSGDMLLEALVACAGVTLKAVATALEFKLGAATVEAEGDLDFRGTLGVAKDAPVGFRAIRLNFNLDTDEPQERIDSLLKLTERYCVVFQTISQKPELMVSAQR